MVQVLCPVVVARQPELDLLDSRMAAALDGDGSFAALLGEAGIGKSRLVREVAKHAESRGAMVVVGRAVPAGAPSAYRPLTEALAQALRVRPVLDDPSLALWLPALGGIVPQIGPPGAAGELSVAMHGEAVLQLLARLGEPAGLVVVLEDLHWADPDTLAVTEYLADNVAGHRVLLLTTARSDHGSEALDLVRRQRSRPGAVVLELGRLSVEDVTTMVRACAPDASGSLLERVRASADGIPLLVEELLASPGVPESFVDAVRQRLARMPSSHRRIVEAAAVLGRHFDWRLLAPMTARPPEEVSDALATAVERMLLRVEDGSFRFRHALTRDAILAEVLPPDQVSLAAAGLGVVEAVHPELSGTWRELAADLAKRSGERDKAAALYIGMGRDALRAGALTTASRILQSAIELHEAGEARSAAVLLLVEALALAGRIDEAATAARAELDRPAGEALNGIERAKLSLLLAEAAVTAGRWRMATEQLAAVIGSSLEDTDPEMTARVSVLEAEIHLAADDVELAKGKAHDAAAMASDASEVRCHALEVLGRIERLRAAPSARRFFEEALSQADAADLALWRARALHELGTLDMFEYLGTGRLDQARSAAEQLGALSTVASIDLQLAAVNISRWTPDAAAAHAHAACRLAETLELHEVRNKALLFLAEAAALRADTDGVDHNLGLARHTEVAGSPWEGYSWGARGEARMAAGDLAKAIECLDRAASILARFEHAEPATFRALWPLLLASVDDGRAVAALADASRCAVDAFNLNRGLLAYGRAIVTGRTGDPGRAVVIIEQADRCFVNATTWRVLARVLAASAARAGGWGEPQAWLDDGIGIFDRLSLPGLSAWCQSRLRNSGQLTLMRAAITARESDVLPLVAGGLANKEIAQRLRLSPRTVEKHIESLLRKTGTRTRTQLAVWAAEAGAYPGVSRDAH